MNLIAQTACDLQEKGDVFVLATIIRHSGSTPRTSGSKMIITADGRGIGTIGGGLLEAKAMSRSVELIQAERSALMPIDLSNETVATMDMICGGEAEVLLDCVVPTEANRHLFRRWNELLEEGGSGCLLTRVITSNHGIERVGHALANARGEIEGDFSLSDFDQDRVAAASPGIRTLTVDGGFLVLDPVERIRTVHIFGAGHVAQPTAQLANLVGFRVWVADDREEYANCERFPDAYEIRVLDSFEKSMPDVALDQNDYLIILTRGHLHDKKVLAQALTTRAGYIGMIGSHKKRNAIYGVLLKEGFTQADIDRVHSPIGLSIGAETPEEIAVSIVAELIAVSAKTKT